MLEIQKKKKAFQKHLDTKFKEKEIYYQDKMHNILQNQRKRSILVKSDIKEYLNVMDATPSGSTEKNLIWLFKDDKN